MKRTENERRKEAATILRQLALGIDPQSGRLLDSSHVAHRPVNSWALLLAAESLCSPAMAPESAECPASVGAFWGNQEDLELRELFREGASQETAAVHERTRSGAGSRLVHLGLVESRR